MIVFQRGKDKQKSPFDSPDQVTNKLGNEHATLDGHGDTCQAVDDV